MKVDLSEEAEVKSRLAAEKNLAFAYESVCAALASERERFSKLRATLDIMAEYQPMGMLEMLANRQELANLKKERVALRADVSERDNTIAALRLRLSVLRLKVGEVETSDAEIPREQTEG